MWSINVKFLRGVCVATDTGQWDETEWPPHPARVFMALAAAHFETAEAHSDSQTRSHHGCALEWLEQQTAPRILASAASTRTPISVFVPVNDSTKTDQLLPQFRGRKERFFPTSIPERDVLHFVFDGEIDATIAKSLDSIAAEVSRIGHSSSLTQVWIDQNFELPADAYDGDVLLQWSPATGASSNAARLRVFSDGTLKGLEQSYNLSAIEEYASLEVEIGNAAGKQKNKLKERMAERFPGGMPLSQRPQSALVIDYVQTGMKTNPPAESCFSSNMMMLSMFEAPKIGLESTLQLAGAVRKKIHDSFPDRTSPEWLGGHSANRAPSARPHMAIVPLPFVDHRHADGHLLGIALVMPRHISEREQAIALRGLFERSDDNEWLLTLTLNEFRRLTDTTAHCDISLIREQRLSAPRTLDPKTWTAPSTVWETVTPIVLDRFPKKDRQQERAAWNAEVEQIIASSCKNIGLPEPFAVHVHHNAFVAGVPKAGPKGSGFPSMVAREGKPTRYQVHARIEFDVPVIGPVILGAGRFVGYGFCRPNLIRCRQRRGLK